MQFHIILDHYYHICVQKVGKARANNKQNTPIRLNEVH